MKSQVLLPKVFNFPFTYNNNQFSLQIGDFVEVPFGKKKEIGIVWPGKISELKKIKIKKISKKFNNYKLDKNFIKFVNWFATYNMMPLGLVLKMSISNYLNLINKKDKDFVQTKKKVKKIILNEEQNKAIKFLNYKNDEFVCASKPRYGTKDGVVGNERGYLVQMSHCIDEASGPLVLKKGDKVRLESYYYVGSHDPRLAYSDGTHLNVMAYMYIGYED